MSQFFSDAIFWINVEKIKPNPFQPRKDFDENRLKDLAESIRQYGVLQPIVVTRKDIQKEDGGIAVEYELISGERRLRATKIAGILQIPVVIRANNESNLMKLELAIIENIQREDLNCIDRAKAFQQLVSEFHFKHAQIAMKIGKSREYVSNSLRILALPEHMLLAISEGKISEGHTRPLLMLIDRKSEQETLFKEIIYKKITVRDAEIIARKIAIERARKIETLFDPELIDLEEKFTESLGTRVRIEKSAKGGKITIDFFSNDDVWAILNLLDSPRKRKADELLDKHIAGTENKDEISKIKEEEGEKEGKKEEGEISLIDDKIILEKKEEENEDLYSVKNFSL
ncbi:MAG: ParB/RepB/Spo0J family partition protein [bacterium]